MTRELIFVDTETTGLDPETEKLVELTWATSTSEPETLWFGVQEVPEFVDNLIGFTKRGIAGRQSDHFAVARFLAASTGNTMVAANPAFDKAFLEKAGLWRFHYRMLDIEAYAYGKISGFMEVPSMKQIADFLNLKQQPDHTSRNDVLAMREAYLIMEDRWR